jgi:hypothetical protein
MGSSTREEAATSAGQTSTRSSTVLKEERRKMSSISSSKIFKNYFILKFKMERKFEKRKLGVIHPVMDKKPFEREKEFLEERFLLKGEQMQVF